MILIPPSDPILNKIALEVPFEQISSPDVQQLIDDMLIIANGEQGNADKKTMVGLAAPQVGVSTRVILCGINSAGKGEQPVLKAFINPVIIARSDAVEDGREGCYSTANVCGIVERARKVTVEAYDRDGNKLTETFEGFPARIVQHEVDHLDGLRFPDVIRDDTKLHWVEAERFGEYREKWAQWGVPCSREQWEKIKASE